MATRTDAPDAPGADVPHAGTTPGGRARLRARVRERRRFRYTLPGLWGALALGCLSFSPSLLPRGGIIQGLIAGITAAIGYGLGVLFASVWRAFADRDARPAGPRARRALAVTAAVALPVAVLAGQVWQARLRALMEAPPPDWWGLAAMPLVAVALAVGLVALGRLLRRLYRAAAERLSRWMGRRAARAIGWILVAAGTYLVVSGLLLDGLVNAADQSFSVRDASTPAGTEQPSSPLRSGSPASLVSWDSLGRQGRVFVAGGPTAAEIAALRGAPALEPIRTYAGIGTAEEVERRARAAVDDLERAGGFERARLLVATTTGTGWVDPGSVDSFEYIAGGDTAVVAMQYSYLPSWLSFLVDQERARAAGRELFDAVYERWSQLPAQARPQLFVFGESLGSFGGETAFSGEYDLRNRTTGALFTGPPNFNTHYRQFTDTRDAGTPEIEPVYRGGRTVRFTNDVAAGAPPRDVAWPGTRVLYMLHPSDPIVWWSPRLVLHRPDWLDEPRGADVLDQMVWIPFVTFWQVTGDMVFSVDVPDGHGHSYTREGVDAWVLLLQPQNWTPEQAERLRATVAAAAD